MARQEPPSVDRQSADAIIDERIYLESEIAGTPLLPPSPRALRDYRRKRQIGFYRIGRDIYYSETHLRDFRAAREVRPLTKAKR